MNIHEHQAKQILKQFGAVVPEGVFGFTVEELLEKCKSLKTDKYVLKAQIHAWIWAFKTYLSVFNDLHFSKSSSTVKPNTPSGTTAPNCFKICLA